MAMQARVNQPPNLKPGRGRARSSDWATLLLVMFGVMIYGLYSGRHDLAILGGLVCGQFLLAVIIVKIVFFAFSRLTRRRR